ncbi:hypothetical protein [Ferribacterium limneticum]|uniref:hypothetical protein n=1 Tax=Ferribacterium limneticum TaxID=76259 RepID=UPI001CFA4DA9|nr:hypothetical protein [Ferribacterium limneticum]UCV20148.1 hypothetical protein KI610_06135 [Ferribacterium limneticum]
MRASHHFLGGWILLLRSISPSRRLALGPQPPDHRQEGKQKQVFHCLSRKQKSLQKSVIFYFLPHFNTLPAASICGPAPELPVSTKQWGMKLVTLLSPERPQRTKQED